MMGWDTGGYAGMGIMGIFGLLILAGIIVLIVWAIRSGARVRSTAAGSVNEPLAELQLRLARGDITPDEYEELRAHLRH